MSNGTRLYQSPRSPLIQGRSKAERPLWEAWLGGTVIGLVTLLLTAGTGPGSRFLALRVPLPIWYATTPAVVLMIVGCVVGAFAGGAIARAAGLRLRWPWAALAAVAGSALVFAVTLGLAAISARG